MMERRSFFRALAGIGGASSVAAASAAAKPDAKPPAPKPGGELTIQINADTSAFEQALDRIKEKMGGAFPLRLEAGGTYVIECEQVLSPVALENLANDLRKELPDIKFVILDCGLKIAR